MTEENKPFTFDDDRKATPPGVNKDPVTEPEQLDPPDTPVFPRDPMSIEEATKKFLAGKAPSPYYGDLPRTSTLTQVENRVQADNMVGHDSHAPSPPQEPLPTGPSNSDETPGLIQSDDEGMCEDRVIGPDAVDSTPLEATDAPEGEDMTQQQCFYVQDRSDKALILDHKTNECFFLKWKTLKKDQRKG